MPSTFEATDEERIKFPNHEELQLELLAGKKEAAQQDATVPNPPFCVLDHDAELQSTLALHFS